LKEKYLQVSMDIRAVSLEPEQMGDGLIMPSSEHKEVVFEDDRVFTLKQDLTRAVLQERGRIHLKPQKEYHGS
jgi:hypothetical protein